MAGPGDAMNGNQPNRPPPVPQFREVPALSLRDTLIGLFLFPHVVLISARRAPRVDRAITLMAIVWVACSLFMGLTLAPSILNEISETAKWLGREMGEVRRTEQGLAWNRAEDAPTTIRHRGVRVDFAQKGETFDIKKVAEKEDSGLWIAPDLVMLWTTRMGQFAVPLFDANSQSERFNRNKDFPVGETIPGDRFEPMALQNLRLLTPVLLVAWQGLGMLAVYLLFLSMFTTIPILLRGPQSVGGFRVSLCVNLYCSVIPFIIATVYSRAAPRTMDFMTVFLFAFFGYLIWSFSRVRRFLSGS